MEPRVVCEDYHTEDWNGNRHAVVTDWRAREKQLLEAGYYLLSGVGTKSSYAIRAVRWPEPTRIKPVSEDV